MIDVKGKTKGDGAFDWKSNLVDAGIISGLTFFTTCAGLTIAQIDDLTPAVIAASTQFFLSLAIKRGLKEKR